MSHLDGPILRLALYEGPGCLRLDAGERFELLSALLDGGHGVTLLHHDSPVPKIDASGWPLLVLGRSDDAQALPAWIAEPSETVRFQDIGTMQADQLLARIGQVLAELKARQPGQWKPWFPVIDFDRCTNCMQCLSFCLFDVYAVNDKEQITVQNQDNCKTDCPACSRVCPEVAILFPKYGKGPINGDVVRQADIQREAMKVDVSALLGGDIYAALRTRQREARKRFSTERDESKALLERKRCLKKLQVDLDIPDEVLMSLPSVGDIEERAARAKEKATLRQARSQTVKDQRPAPSIEEWGI